MNPSALAPETKTSTYPVVAGVDVLLGRGLNSFTHEVKGNCVERGRTTTLGGRSSVPVAEAGYDLYYARDYRALGEFLNVDGHARARFGFGTVGAEAEYVNSQDFSSRSSFLVVWGNAYLSTEVLESYSIRDDALRLLRENPNAFLRRCGDQFVSARVLGATMFAIAEIRDTSSSEQRSIEGSISYDALVASIGGSVKHQSTDLEARHSLRYKLIQRGLSEPAPQDFDGFAALAARVPRLLQSGAGAPVYFTARSYATADNFPAEVSMPSLIEQQRRLEQLAMWHRETQIAVNDLDRAYAEPKACGKRDERYERVRGNLVATLGRIETQAKACFDDPSAGCGGAMTRSPNAGQPVQRFTRECSDRAGAEARRIAAERRTQQQREALAEQERRIEAEERRRQHALRGTPHGEACRRWLISRIDFIGPSSKSNGNQWDFDNNTPETYLRIATAGGTRETGYSPGRKRSFSIDPVIPVRTGERISIKAYDWDEFSDDDWIATTHLEFPARLDGSLLVKRDTRATVKLHARCE